MELGMSIPLLLSTGELPEGEHIATLDEVEKEFGASSDRRIELMQGLRRAAKNFEAAGVKRIWLNGSFVTGKANPNDIDGCWEYILSVDMKILDPIFIQSPEEIKNKYGLDFYIANLVEGGSGLPFPDFFQLNRDGDPKGIILIRLGDKL